MVNVAVVGVGWWGQTLVRLLRQSDELRVMGLVDPNPQAASFARSTGLPLLADYEAALADPLVDAVVLCTPHSLHCRQIIAAANAGKHVFSEKPLCLTRDEVMQATEAMRAKGLHLGVGHEKRFERPFVEIQRLVSEGSLGRILQIEGNFNHDKLTALTSDNWRLSASEAPAGPLTATGIHLVDLAVSLLGPASTVCAHVAQLDSPLKNGDTLAVLMQFSGGGHALISSVLATPFSGRFAVYGSKGWAEVRDKSHPENAEGWTLTKSVRGTAPCVADYPADGSVLANLEAFAGAIEGSAPYPVGFDEMIHTVSALESIGRSAVSGIVERVIA